MNRLYSEHCAGHLVTFGRTIVPFDDNGYSIWVTDEIAATAETVPGFEVIRNAVPSFVGAVLNCVDAVVNSLQDLAKKHFDASAPGDLESAAMSPGEIVIGPTIESSIDSTTTRSKRGRA